MKRVNIDKAIVMLIKNLDVNFSSVMVFLLGNIILRVIC